MADAYFAAEFFKERGLFGGGMGRMGIALRGRPPTGGGSKGLRAWGMGNRGLAM